MSKPHYFNADAIDRDGDDAHAYTITRHRQEMEEHGETERRLYRCRPMRGSDIFFCRHHQEVGLKSESTCGKECDAYAPRNGKTGRCRHSTHCGEPDMEEVYVIRAKAK